MLDHTKVLFLMFWGTSTLFSIVAASIYIPIKGVHTFWVTQWWPILCNPVDSFVHAIFQARILEWVSYPFSRGSSQSRNWTRISCIAGRFFTSWATSEALKSLYSNINILFEISYKKFQQNRLKNRLYDQSLFLLQFNKSLDLC